MDTALFVWGFSLLKYEDVCSQCQFNLRVSSLQIVPGISKESMHVFTYRARFTSNEVAIQSSVFTWTAVERRQKAKSLHESLPPQVSHTDHEVQWKRTRRPLWPLCCPTVWLEMTFQQDPPSLWDVEWDQDMPTTIGSSLLHFNSSLS